MNVQAKRAPLVSVIVPIYNVEDFLDQCLTSVRSQTLQDLEVIALNDGSTDSSLDILEKHAKEDDRIVVVNKANEGYGKTCNKGIGLARGEWIAIVEPDDWISEDMYFQMIDFACDSEIKFGKQIDIVKTPWYEVKGWDCETNKGIAKGNLYGHLRTSLKPTDITKKTALLESHPSIWSAIYRRTFLLENNIKFPEYPGAGWADNPFSVDTVMNAKAIIYLNRPFYYYRVELPKGADEARAQKSEQEIAMPFDRWLFMSEQLRNMGATDEKIWQAHYVRGFNYLRDAILESGEDNEVVKKKRKQMFESMDSRLVLQHPILHPSFKEMYASVMGIDSNVPKAQISRVKALLKNIVYSIKQEGFSGLARYTRGITRIPARILKR